MTLGATIQITADMVAWYGAVVATLAILIAAWGTWTNWFVAKRDRKQLAVDGFTIVDMPGAKERGHRLTLVSVTARNIGRRPLTLLRRVYVGFSDSDKTQIALEGEWKPKLRLNEGERAVFVGRFKDKILDPRGIVDVHVQDESGDKWMGENRIFD